MSETLRWWVMMQVVALALLPLCLTLFRRLPDRGYGLSKAFGLIMVGYVFWAGNAAYIVPNNAGGVWLVLLAFGAASAYVTYRRRDDLLAFLRNNIWTVASVEVVFFLAFATAVYLRSFVGDINQTEQPMDFMFLNAVTNADRFPPEDPWLVGENVAYYYFGYLLVSVMTQVAGFATSVGYNLGLAMIVAMAAVGAFSLVYNLAAAQRDVPSDAARHSGSDVPVRPLLFGGAAAVLLTSMGNLEGLLEWISAHNLGSSGFWAWWNVENLVPYQSTRWYPDAHWFWWQATRIIPTSETLLGIHEFPFFSFLLGDLHPHVMSIPFILLAVGAALALLRSDSPIDLVFWLERPWWLPALAIMLGGLAFLNTWDMPTLAVLVFTVGLLRNRLTAQRWSWGLVLDTAGFVLPLFIAAFLAYTPFFFGGFDSQASGFTADSSEGTSPIHALLVWGPLAVLVLPYAAWRLARNGGVSAYHIAWALLPGAAVIVLWFSWDVISSGLGWLLPASLEPNEGAESAWTRLTSRDWSLLTAVILVGIVALSLLALWRETDAAKEETQRRSSHVFALALILVSALLVLGAEFFFIQDQFNARMNTVFKLYYQAWLLLSIAGGFALYELAREWRSLPAAVVRGRVEFRPTLGDWSWGELGVAGATLAGAVVGVVLMRDSVVGLMIVGALIGGGVLFALSSLVVLAWRAAEPPERATASVVSWRSVWAGAIAAFVVAAFVYPITATYNRTNDFKSSQTLDGLRYVREGNPDEYAAIQWVGDRSGDMVIAEAVGHGYRAETSRVSGATGVPTILGWQGHESQWRGGPEDFAGRPEDLQTLYTSTDTDTVRSIIQKYGLTHVFVGPAERAEYQDVAIPQMTDLFEPAFEQGEVVIYRVRTDAITSAGE
jgi:YYY domain-containing protein